jgi:hypothetical protein
MENKTTDWQSIKNILIIALIIGIFFSIWQCNRKDDIIIKDNKAPDNAYQYETKEIYKDKYFDLKDSLKNLIPVKPITIIKWKKDIEYLPTPNEGPYTETIFDTIRIPIADTSKYNKNPRLVRLGLVQDSLSLTLFNNKNELYTENYPIYLGSYGYVWKDNQLNMYNIDKDKKTTSKDPNSKISWNNLYFNAGYSVYANKPTTGLEYNLTYKRLKLDLNSEVLIIEQPKLNLNAKLGYRLLK